MSESEVQLQQAAGARRSPSVAELCECLLEVGSEALLDQPLERLIASIEDGDTRELFEHMASDHRGFNLRAVLRFRELDPWVARTCTEGEARRICAQLQWWLLGERRSERQALDDALQHADDEAQRRQQLRAAAWQKPLDTPALRQLHERLYELLRHCAGAAEAAPLPARSRPLQLDLTRAVVQASLCSDARQRTQARFGVFHCELRLQGFEAQPLRARCSCTEPCDEPRVRCAHVRVLVTELLDALHDPNAALHGQLLRLCATPSWVRFMDALNAGEPATRTDPAIESERLAWKLRVLADGSLALAPALQRRLRTGAWSAGARVALDRLPSSLALEVQDELVIALLRTAAVASDGFYACSLAWLRALSGHPRIFGADDNAPRVLEEGRIELVFEARAGGVEVRAVLAGRALADLAETPASDHIAQLEPNGHVLFAGLPAQLARWLRAIESHGTLLPQASYDALRQRLLELQPHAGLQLSEELRGVAEPPQRRLLLRLSPGLGEGIRASLHCRPLPFGPVWSPGQGPPEALGERAGERVFALRDLAWERATAAKLVEELRLEIGFEEGPFRYRIDALDDALMVLERVAQAGERVEIEWLEGQRKLQLVQPIRRANLKLRVSEAKGWYEVSGYAQLADGMRVELAALLDAARTGQRYVRVGAGSYAQLHDELRERLEQAHHVVYSDRERLKLAASVLPRLFELVHEPASVELTQPTAAIWARMQAAEQAAVEAPAELVNTLRPYQREGVQFLLRMASWGSGACLADDMGLGKTLQALAVLIARAELGPALIVAPTSVCDGWRLEAQQFAPQLNLRVYRGPKRPRLREELAARDVLITSYELLQRDRLALQPLRFATLVLDEAHMIKNAMTDRARATAAMDAQFRIALTGTPVENHLGELWGLMAQLNPAVLGGWARFRTHFGMPIEKYGDQERLSVLRQIVRPFILRRTKLQVAPELPARLEVTKKIALSQAEQGLYDAAVLELQKRVGKRRKLDLDRVSLLAEITRLRQLACSPRLLMPDLVLESSKVRSLLELLDGLLPAGHRALVFSQFVGHLALVREALAARGWAHLYLDGSTPAAERGELVQRWQRGETDLFLISLKAGGTGLNLSGADYVFHLDPWWNPAAEDQASDRAHRIGQARPVTIVRMVAEATVEEQVLSLHAQKRELANALLEGAEGAAAARLDVDELAAFLGLT